MTKLDLGNIVVAKNRASQMADERLAAKKAQALKIKHQSKRLRNSFAKRLAAVDDQEKLLRAVLRIQNQWRRVIARKRMQEKRNMLLKRKEETKIKHGTSAFLHTRKQTLTPDQIAAKTYSSQQLVAFTWCGILPVEHPIRRTALKISDSKHFDNVMIFFIILNAIVLGMVDYSHFDAATGAPTREGLRNELVFGLEPVFTIIFVVEFLIKITALGFYSRWPTSYMKDPWNWLDFTVVVTSVLSTIPGMPTASGLRLIRALRPLRALSRFPVMRSLVAALLASFGPLSNVLTVLAFFFAILGILSIQLWGWNGALHGRCRLTERPIRLPDSVIDAHINHTYLHSKHLLNLTTPCLPAYLDTDPLAPAEQQQRCVWPIDTEQNHLCRISDWSHGVGRCDEGTWCGSNYDKKGRPRFEDPLIMEADLHDPRLAYGFTVFDTMPEAVMTIFHCLTLEGWRFTMFHIEDGYGAFGGIAFSILLIVFGNFLMLNLTLAAIWESFYGLEKRQHEEDCRRRYSPLYLQLDSNLCEENGFLLSFTRMEMNQRIIYDEYGIEWASFWKEAGVMGLTADGYVDFDEFCVLMWHCEQLKKTRDKAKAKSAIKVKEVDKGLKGCLKSNSFEWFMLCAILLNTVLLGLDRWPGNEEEENTIDQISFCLTMLFLLEILLKMSVFGLFGKSGFFSDNFNTFDLTVVIISLVELAVSPPNFLVAADQADSGGSISSLRALRIFRALRLARAVRNNRKLKHFMDTILRVVGSVGHVGGLFLLFLYIFGLLGMQMAANYFRFDDNGYAVPTDDPQWASAERPRAHFDDILVVQLKSELYNMNSATSTVFRILTLDTWNESLYDARRAVGSISILFYLLVIVFGNFLLTNLFCAMVLKEFDMALKRELAEVKEDLGEDGVDDYVEDMQELLEVKQDVEPLKGVSLYIFPHDSPIRIKIASMIYSSLFKNGVLLLIAWSSVCLALDNPLGNPNSSLATMLHIMEGIMLVLFTLEMALKVIALTFRTYIRDNWNKLDCFIVCSSLVSIGLQFAGSDVSDLSGLRALRALRAFRPLRLVSRNPAMKQVVSALFQSLPGAANLLLMVTLYLFVCSVTMVSQFKGKLFACQGERFDGLSAPAQALVTYPRPLDMLDAEQHQAVVLEMAPKQLLAFGNLMSPITSKQVCHSFGAEWAYTIPQNFNNVVQGMISLFEMMTLAGWSVIMYAVVDATDIDMQPIRDYNPYMMIPLMGFIFVGAIFLMNLFMGVLIDNFNRIKAGSGTKQSIFLTGDQAKYMRMEQMMLQLHEQHLAEKPPTNPCRAPFFKISTGHGGWKGANFVFEGAIMSLIVANTVVMGLRHFGQTQAFGNFIEHFNYLCAILFTLEAMVRVTGLGFRTYWSDNWNKFDFLLVCATNTGIILNLLIGVKAGGMASIVRVLRLGRVVRLLRAARGLHMVSQIIAISLPAICNIASLQLLVIFIYALLGMQMLSKVAFHNTHVLGDRLNFQTFGKSIYTLIVVSTGDPWQLMMHDLARSPENCVASPSYDERMCGFSDALDCIPLNGCGGHFAYVYFISFAVITQLVFANLFIAVIIEGASDATELMHGNREMNGDHEIGLTVEEYKLFCEAWAALDSNLDQTLDETSVFLIVSTLVPPLGFGTAPVFLDEWKADSRKIPLDEMKRKMALLNITEDHISESGTKFYDITGVTHALGKRIFSSLLAGAEQEAGRAREAKGGGQQSDLEQAKEARELAEKIMRGRQVVARTTCAKTHATEAQHAEMTVTERASIRNSISMFLDPETMQGLAREVEMEEAQNWQIPEGKLLSTALPGQGSLVQGKVIGTIDKNGTAQAHDALFTHVNQKILI